MKITAKTIAEQLGMSTATVDRALNSRGGVSPKTLNKIKDKAKELNYRPNKSASFLSRKKDIRVAFVFPDYPEYFWKEIESGIKLTLEDIYHYGFDIEIIKTSHDIQLQKDVVQNIIKSKSYDALVFAPADSTPFTNVIDTGIEQDFPIYTFNNDCPSSKRLSYVGADYLDSGRLAGELLYQFTNTSKKFALISDEMNTFQMQQKVLGFREFMSQGEELDLVGPLKIVSSRLRDSIAELKNELKDVDGIYVACGALADVAKGIQRMDLIKKPTLIGHDISKEIYDFLQKGIVTASISQDPLYQGILSVKTVFNHLMLEEKIEKVENIVKLEIVTKGNAKYYIRDD